jgi:tRNA-specific 2-thiouridylase
VRDVARRLGLPVAEKPDSQEICFVPDGDYAAFIERKTGDLDSGGSIVSQSGEVLGSHSGVHRFTVGQRKGLGIAAAEPLYVLQLRPAEKTIVVGPRPALERTTLTASNVNWIAGAPPTAPLRVTAQIRHRHHPAAGTVFAIDNNRASMEFDAPVSAITPGQSVVFYDGDVVLGGGWID